MEACQQYQRWRRDGVRVPRVSVNVSNGQLPRSNFVPTVQQLLQATDMPPGALEMEVTESMLVEGGKAAMEALNLLSKEGVLIAIDDFGTGYSSFSYLKTMPAQVLKMDMSFLVDARLDNDSGKIVAAIINMAHALQKEVVAEGVERVDQLKLLKSLGCERGQGFLFGKGVPAENIARTFRRVEEVPDAGAAAPVLNEPALPVSDDDAALAALHGARARALEHAAARPLAPDPEPALTLPALAPALPVVPAHAPANAAPAVEPTADAMAHTWPLPLDGHESPYQAMAAADADAFPDTIVETEGVPHVALPSTLPLAEAH